MVMKLVFLVLLGSAFVLSNPIPKDGNDNVSLPAIADGKVEDVIAVADEKGGNGDDKDDMEFGDLSFDDIEGNKNDEELTSTTAVSTNKVKKAIAWTKKWTKRIVNKVKKVAKEGKESYDSFKKIVKGAMSDIKESAQKVKTFFEDAKATGKELAKEYKDLKAELGDAWKTVKTIGQEGYTEIKSIG